MKRNMTTKSLLAFLIVVASLVLTSKTTAQSRKVQAAFNPEASTQQPLYTEYKGVRLGMSTADVRAKLGAPTLKGSDQDYYVFSENQTAQIAYDAAQKTITISVDYVGGVGAPDYQVVVGGELERTSNGSLYRLVRYENLGFWVSYNRTTGAMPIVTVTIQKDMAAK